MTISTPNISHILRQNVIDIITAGRNALKPLPNISGSEWAEQYRYVSIESSLRSGKWNNDVVPYANEWMDVATDPAVEEMTVWSSSQVGKTETLLNIVGYYIHIDPSPILILQPTLEMARAFSREKMEPMIRDTEVVRERVARSKSRSEDNTILHKRFIGGNLDIAGSNSPNSLAQRSKRICITDDADRCASSAGNEGDPVELAEKRTQTYFNRKKIRFSTCTIEGISRIEKYYANSDQRKPFVPCPKCNHYQVLDFFTGLKWDKETDLFGNVTKHLPQTAYYECSECKAHLTEADKYTMIANLKWIPTNPSALSHRGYWINELYSPFSTWAQMAADFLKCGDDKDELRVFYNTSLGKLWKLEESTGIDESGLLDRVENYCTSDHPTIPKEVLLLTAGVDTQADRLELKVKGYGIGRESWLIHYEKFWGDTDQDDVYNHLLDFINNQTWTREDGVQLSIQRTFIDSGGHNTQSVYQFCKKQDPRRICAIKGHDGWGKPILLNRVKVGKDRRTILQNIGVDTAKELIYSSIKRTSGPRAMHFTSAFCDFEYFRQLTSEKAVKAYDKKHRFTIVWKKKNTNIRNEALDCEVYAMAAMESLMPNFEKLKTNLDKEAELVGKEKPKPIIDKQPEVIHTQRRITMPKKKWNVKVV